MCLDESREMMLMHHHVKSFLPHTAQIILPLTLCASSRVESQSNIQQEVSSLHINCGSPRRTNFRDWYPSVVSTCRPSTFQVAVSCPTIVCLCLFDNRQVSIHPGRWLLCVYCESREWFSIQWNHITLPSTSSRCWLLFAPQKRESQYISPSCHLIIQSNSYFFWSQWFISLFRDWYVQHKSPLSFQWQVLERSDWFKYK